ncbi:MAG: hypothetical protein HOH88_04825 [Flavobacteriales bacterium]|nr:hypothetical protein [Flavobacteriales bacterium]
MRNLLFLFSILIISSCTKIDDVIVNDNILPPDYTIENTTIDHYINKLYISTIGREPTEIEFTSDFSVLRESNLGQESREIVIDGILNKEEYNNNLFKLESEHLLLGLDTADINQNIHVLTVLLTTAHGLDSIYFVENLEKMLKLQEVLPGLGDGTISNMEMHKRMVNNNMYDEINMGTENFVISMFQSFFGRYPTTTELENGKLMVNDNNASVFFIPGNGKEDFINIFIESDEYYTGQTKILFNRYLFRDPNSEESVNYSLDYINSQNYKLLQRRILSTNEFIGI